MKDYPTYEDYIKSFKRTPKLLKQVSLIAKDKLDNKDYDNEFHRTYLEWIAGTIFNED